MLFLCFFSEKLICLSTFLSIKPALVYFKIKAATLSIKIRNVLCGNLKECYIKMHILCFFLNLMRLSSMEFQLGKMFFCIKVN